MTQGKVLINYDKTCQNRFIGITAQPGTSNVLIMK
jgi:hypothetical protein